MPRLSHCDGCKKTDIALFNCSRCRTTAYCSTSCQTQQWATHKPTCIRPDYILQITIKGHPEAPLSTPITRTLSLPSTFTFLKLHTAIQIAFGWANRHSYQFAIHDLGFDASQPEDFMALIARRAKQDAAQFRGDEAAPRQYLLRIVDREPVHKIDRMHEGDHVHPRTVEKHAAVAKLWTVFDDVALKDQKMTYLYDFGDNWAHEIALVGTSPATTAARCLDGHGHGMAEDAGSFGGWRELVSAYAATRPTAEQRERREWFEKFAADADPQGLGNGAVERWDMESVNSRLSIL